MESSDGAGRAATRVRHFRQILLWPLQLIPLEARQQVQRRPWERLRPGAPGSPWFEVVDEFTGDCSQFQERHYSEFVTFLPSVQRFLYGEGGQRGYGESPIRVFRRADVQRARLTLKDHPRQVELSIAHVDLYFLYDLDVVLLAVEAHADDLELSVVQELLFRFGRTYPSYWDAEGGGGGECLVRAEWLSAAGEVLVVSDFEQRAKYLAFVCEQRTAAISADWEFLLAPMGLQASGRTPALAFRQLEYDRMPLMAYLALEDPAALTRADFVRLGLATRPGDPGRLPFSERFVAHFEQTGYEDRYWEVEDPAVPRVRFLCSGHTFLMVGDAHEPFFTDRERGLLGQFRHQYFLLGLIAHFHQAALLMFEDRLVAAVSQLDIRDTESIKAFKRRIRQTFEIFLRFTHRYWFLEVSIHPLTQALFAMWRRHLGTSALYDNVRSEVQDMAQYLETDSLRRQANTVVRLTVVTTVGLIATIATGFLGMNLIAAAEQPFVWRALFFALVLGLTVLLVVGTVAVSKRMADLLEVLSDERLPGREKVAAFIRVWADGRVPVAPRKDARAPPGPAPSR